MARRAAPEINAGSMADIAFLLLVFFLMVTTIDTELGIQRQLPPIVEEPPEVDVKQRNVYVVLVNKDDELLVEGEFMDIGELKDGAKEFMISNGVFQDKGEKDDFPIKRWVRKADIEENLRLLEAAKKGMTDNEAKDIDKQIKALEKKLIAVEELKGPYLELPGQAVISMQNDNGTSYNMYIQVQNELSAAINELRDELAEERFGRTYTELVEESETDQDNEALKRQIWTVRAVFPQKISEAEPKNVGNYYN